MQNTLKKLKKTSSPDSDPIDIQKEYQTMLAKVYFNLAECSRFSKELVEAITWSRSGVFLALKYIGESHSFTQQIRRQL